jgi:hypothetical protein
MGEPFKEIKTKALTFKRSPILSSDHRKKNGVNGGVVAGGIYGKSDSTTASRSFSGTVPKYSVYHPPAAEKYFTSEIML